MESIYENGGMIGATLSFDDDEKYIIGETTELATLEYVGGTTYSTLGTTSNFNVPLTSLTGGLSSSPQEGDLVIVALGIGALGVTGFSNRINGYTIVVNITALDSIDTNLQVGYKIMSSSPDTIVTIGGTASGTYAGAVVVHVWRNVDTTTPLDVSTTSATVSNTVIPDPPSITPSTSGAQIIVMASGGHQRGTAGIFSASYLNNFRTDIGDDTYDVTVGMGNIAWTSGSYNPAAFAFAGADSTSYSASSATMAIRPATVPVPVFGNQKNSGIWNLEAVYSSSGIVRAGLALYLDAANSASYSGSGANWNDISGNEKDFLWYGGGTNYEVDSGVPCFATLGDRCRGPASNSFGIDNTSGYTIFLVVKQITLTSSAAFQFYKDGTGDTTRGIFSHLAFINGVIYFDQGGCCTTDYRTQVASGGTSDWNVWTLRRETAGSARSIFKNGILLATNTDTAANLNLNSNPVDLGSAVDFGDSSSAWNAKLNSFLVYNRGLTDDEVLKNANIIKQRYGI